VDLGSATTAELVLDVTETVGATLAVSVETARTQTATTWRTVAPFNTAVSTFTEERTFVGLERWIRIRWTLTGSATFGVSGESLIVYCTPSDMKRIIAEQSLIRDQNDNYSDEELDGFAQDATDEVSGSLGAVFELPLSAWGRDVRRKTAEVAVFYGITARGYQPDEPSGKTLRMMFDDAQRWLERVREEELELHGVVDATPDIEDGGAYVVTNASRGWGP
jgi:phage gp36-like protein